MNTEQILGGLGWSIRATLDLPSRPARLADPRGLPLAAETRAFLSKSFPGGMYSHQVEAIKVALQGQDICLGTGTASGKTAVFQTAVIQELTRDPQATFLAIYPMRALGREQESRWSDALKVAGLEAQVARIEGTIARSNRNQLLRQARVICATPDVLHAWMLSSLHEPAVRSFLERLVLIVVDEVHNYTGVFGSNAAYLFRRLQLAVRTLGGHCRFIAASATISDPQRHLKDLIGRDFVLITEDGSPHHTVRIYLADPRESADALSEASNLLGAMAESSDHRFLAFTDSRKQTEYLTSILMRVHDPDEDPVDAGDLHSMRVVPYRAGYEESDRVQIQERLSEGSVQGVISTSALELGIDISHLTTAVLYGVPRNSTSFYQRIGRVGRNGPGEVIVVNTHDLQTERIFADPPALLDMPKSESALYLGNRRVQYIHALCVARSGGEIDQLTGNHRDDLPEEWDQGVEWPEGFLETCRAERSGQLPSDLQAMKAEAGDAPTYTYPLRDVDSQFEVELRRGMVRDRLGSLSFAQLTREAYPGAVYYYAGRPYRVSQVKIRDRKVVVRPERRYTTTPIFLPAVVYPKTESGSIHASQRWDDLRVVECDVQVRNTLIGFSEKRGPSSSTVAYPLDPSRGLYFDQPRFTRTVFTSAVLLFHPVLDSLSPTQLEALAQFVLHAFLTVLPFGRQDLDAAGGRLLQDSPLGAIGARFIAVYDQTYGSLRLSGRLLEDNVLQGVMCRAAELLELAKPEDDPGVACEVVAVMERSLRRPLQPWVLEARENQVGDAEGLARVILPGSRGLNVRRGNVEFLVEGVFFSPQFSGLAYRGRYPGGELRNLGNGTVAVRVEDVVEIPDESAVGIFSQRLGCFQTADTRHEGGEEIANMPGRNSFSPL